MSVIIDFLKGEGEDNEGRKLADYFDEFANDEWWR